MNEMIRRGPANEHPNTASQESIPHYLRPDLEPSSSSETIREERRESAASQKPAPGPSGTTNPQKSRASDCRHLLIVDDNDINLKVSRPTSPFLRETLSSQFIQILSTFAKKIGCTYDTACDGLAALNACRDSLSPYDLVLMGTAFIPHC